MHNVTNKISKMYSSKLPLHKSNVHYAAFNAVHNAIQRNIHNAIMNTTHLHTFNSPACAYIHSNGHIEMTTVARYILSHKSRKHKVSTCKMAAVHCPNERIRVEEPSECCVIKNHTFWDYVFMVLTELFIFVMLYVWYLKGLFEISFITVSIVIYLMKQGFIDFI